MGGIIIDNVKVFLQIEPKITAEPGQIIKIKDIASIFCTDKKAEKSILELEVHNISGRKINDVIPALRIIKTIYKYDENIDLTVMGEAEILIDVQGDTNESKLFSIIKTVIVCFILFLGAGLAIVNFHADVNMDKSLQIIYRMVTGEENHKPLILLIPYSIGIGVGMATFFNHVFQKKWKKEPSPLEVEMFMYEKNIDDYILDKTKHN
ncbi:stage V sporulation protein AA [Proteiniborus sp. MB09-C3]|uniref:stage V sporulation protein AA n=1 Tax=Proteiniborus sp. MB09-C3 TaxID=3050072 RepID=UPI002556DB2A|nr:stage V sporulation protein AA [Proteiniborus sp. MB09-C3]WIV10720.1 stage V sporulation protein AA [Proteiniborus sp. MB09-C3]